MPHIDYLIVGQGLAGSLLAHTLLNLKHKVLVIDDANPRAASKVSSGVINPITGRRLVKSWMYDELKVAFVKMYQELELEFKETIIKPSTIIRTTSSIQDENVWSAMALDQPELCIQNIEDNPWKEVAITNFSFGGIRGYRVQVKRLLDLIRNKLIQNQSLRIEPFDHSKISFINGSVTYTDIVAKKIIFCEGWKVMNNPYFNQQAFEPAKGEVLYISSPSLTSQLILKHKLSLVPIDEDKYWVGSTFAWNTDVEEPTSQKLEYLSSVLKDVLNVPFDTVDHIAGIRPSTRDRRPIVQVHPTHPELLILNGLGAKGTSLAPYFTLQLIDLLNK